MIARVQSLASTRTKRIRRRSGRSNWPGLSFRYAAISASEAVVFDTIDAKSTAAQAARTFSFRYVKACSSSASDTLAPARTACSTLNRVRSRRTSASNVAAVVPRRRRNSW